MTAAATVTRPSRRGCRSSSRAQAQRRSTSSGCRRRRRDHAMRCARISTAPAASAAARRGARGPTSRTRRSRSAVRRAARSRLLGCEPPRPLQGARQPHAAPPKVAPAAPLSCPFIEDTVMTSGARPRLSPSPPRARRHRVGDRRGGPADQPCQVPGGGAERPRAMAASHVHEDRRQRLGSPAPASTARCCSGGTFA